MGLEEQLDIAFSEHVIKEGRRLRPAMIIMKRGTRIAADHVRVVRGHTGFTVVVAGIGISGKQDTWSSYGGSSRFVRGLPDFFTHKYVPASWAHVEGRWYHHLDPAVQQDDTGWSEPYAKYGGMGYDAHRAVTVTRKFKKILTINPENIAEIQGRQPGESWRGSFTPTD